MKRSLLIALFVAVVICPLYAQQDSKAANQPPTREQVLKYFEIMHLHDQMQTMLQTQQKQMNVMAGDMFKKMIPDATPEQTGRFQSLMNELMNDLIKNYPIDDVLRDMVPVYQNHLSESDMNAIIAFYASPSGQKVIREMPAMTAEAMRVSYARLQPQIEEMMKKMRERIEKMAAEDRQGKDANGAGTQTKN
jgi:hypothetical protein